MPRSIVLLLAALLLTAACAGGASLFTTTPEQVEPTTTLGDAEVATTATTPGSGTVWVRVPQDEALFGGGELASVAAGGPGLIAVGSIYSDGDLDAAVWVSPDGLAWSRVAHDESVFGGPEDQKMAWLTVGGPGLVAVGYDGSGGDWDAAVWVSPDGLAWSRVAADATVLGGQGSQTMSGLAAGGPGLVAVGYDTANGDEDAAVWVSSDGLAWSRVAHDDALFGGPDAQVMTGVAAAGPGLVGVGYDILGGAWDAAVWVSSDGLAWSRVAHDDAVFGGPGLEEMLGVAAAGPGVVAVGRAGTGGDLDAAVWVSSDGLAWSRVAHDDAVFGGPDFQEMAGVAAAGPGVVAVGYDFSGGDWDGAVWTSEDGFTWSRVSDDEALFGGAYSQQLFGVAAGGSGVVAVGYDSAGLPSAAVWTSRG